MKILQRYLSRDFLRYFAASTTVFLALFLVVTFFDRLRFLLKFRASVGSGATLLAALAPSMLLQAAPLAVLVATLLSVTILSRNGEITAFRCGGISLRSLAAPYLFCGLVASVFSLFLQELVVPPASSFARQVDELWIRGNPPASLLQEGNLWLRSQQRILHVGQVLFEEKRLMTVTVFELDQGRVARRIDAMQAQWDGSSWVLSDAEQRTFDPSGAVSLDKADRMTYPLSAGPEDFRLARVDAEEISWLRLRRLADRYRSQGLDSRDLEIGLWAKTSLPFASLVMPLLGFPFALRAGRRGGTSLGVALGIGIGFVYWLALALGLSLAKADILPTPLGAWAGNLVFATVGAVLLRRAERVS